MALVTDDASPDAHGADDDGESIEERCFSAALICLEGHYTQSPPMGPQTAARVSSMISKTLEKTHTLRAAREALSRNVAIWVWLTRIFAAAIPSLTTRSVGPLSTINDPDKGVTPQESTALIVMNQASIKEDLATLIKLMHIARNLLVNAEPEVPQDICAAVHFDQMVYQTIILCVNVSSKGYDGEILDDAQRLKLNDITELYKKLLVTSLQQAHNWTAKHDRNKMSFWLDVLFDEDEPAYNSGPEEGINDGSGFRPDVAKQQVQHWLDRNSRMCDTARRLLKDYAKNHADKPPGNLAPIRPLAWNWLPDGVAPPPIDLCDDTERVNPIWKPDETDRFQQDRAYGRVSREIDTWWLRARDPNYEEWLVGMPTIEFAQSRTEHCKSNLLHRYAHSYQGEQSPVAERVEEELSDPEPCPCDECHDCPHETAKESGDRPDQGCQHQERGGHDHGHQNVDDHHGHRLDHVHDQNHDYANEYVDEMMDDEEVDDDVSYVEGPLTGILTEVPNILDPKQIEALHMIIKSCVLDNAGSGLTRVGENLQKTRCRMLLALDCGKSLLRELLVFIAVWGKDEQSLIFQVTTQMVEALHHSALIPYAWNSLRIPKDIISPAQTVLLRLVNNMLRARIHSPLGQGPKDETRDVKLVHFFFSYFRSRIVPECAALMHLQAQIRQQNCDPAEFPVDSWDMERAKDGLAQYLDFIITVTESPDTRAKLIEWEAIYDLVTLLTGLDAGVEKKPLMELPKRSPKREKSNPMVERPYSTNSDSPPPSPPPPPMQEPAHKYPWPAVKAQIFTIMATLLQPPAGQSSPGNAQVQMQMVTHNGIVPLLNCCAYDDHNPFAKERVTICLKWLLDGCEAANSFFRELVSFAPPAGLQPPPPGGETVSSVRLDGIGGEIRVKMRAALEPDVREAAAGGGGVGVAGGGHGNPVDDLFGRDALLSVEVSPPTTTLGSIEDDFMA
ncbi:essential cytoplasmic protein Ctr86 [Ophiocordyceps camponoti-floridani]|uniref:Ataxin-10 homolog n=1 Tax=Ophiocordyceps camponoti-floridani TaxID=2030778 RepID=A0A8H4QDJ6_9HYPO|nr:essential cytoplasmic protein Ctr86 [Ophiocordyceps camponoti-floridani]